MASLMAIRRATSSFSSFKVTSLHSPASIFNRSTLKSFSTSTAPNPNQWNQPLNQWDNQNQTFQRHQTPQNYPPNVPQQGFYRRTLISVLILTSKISTQTLIIVLITPKMSKVLIRIIGKTLISVRIIHHKPQFRDRTFHHNNSNTLPIIRLKTLTLV
ncbi:hypothetical protein HanRHA438_Chr03g0123051 [Helianthus annuus]|nr:hypothetical protein HanRHA438_Chr03g0123051 [Helianthus annuus]